jgi:predicted Zn finger-like uncharacterized protein
MSLNTRCPACETVFKVVPDQLKVSSGWVRCGRCAEVFDAATHMLTPAGSTAKPVASKAPEPIHQPTQPVAAAPITVAVAVAVTAPPKPPSPSGLATHRAIAVADARVVSAPHTSPSASVEEEAHGSDFGQVAELSFVRHAKNQAFWRQAWVVRGLMTTLIALSVVLVFQIVLNQRDLIAAKYPGLQSSLERLCSPLDCRIDPVKQLDALKIESSTFQKTQESALGETFALKVTLKNNAALSLAAPALELSLTDANDTAVLRRVLQPEELGFPGKTLAASGEWNGVLSIFISSNTTQNHPVTTVTGFRVLAFYP